MVSPIDWESQIGRRLRLRDLHVFLTVVQRGSMAKAAQQLGVTQPAVSRVIAELEHTLGVRLLERSAKGVEPSAYGRALLRRSTVAFDELRQSIRDIEFLAEPATGEVRIGCSEMVAAAILPAVIQRFSQAYPQVVLHVEQLGSHTASQTLELPELHERSLDIAMLLLAKPSADEPFVEGVNVEVLFLDKLVVAAGKHTAWANRRKIALSELAGERWILSGPHSWNFAELANAFHACGVNMPKINLVTLSTHLRVNLLAAGSFIATFPNSVLQSYGERFSLKILPVHLPVRPWPVALVTLKGRILTPAVERFIECAREVTKSFTRPKNGIVLPTRAEVR
jgi:DNA-binding transcriptional LysR family regulator